MKLKKKLIFYDRVLKVFVGTWFIIWSIYFTKWYLQIWLLLFSLVQISVAFIWSCPLYKFIWLNLIEKRKHWIIEKLIIFLVSSNIIINIYQW